MEKEGDCKAISIILALLIHGIVVFLSDDDFVDFWTISVFLEKNLVPTLLADVYYYLHMRHEKKKGVVL